MKKAVLIGFILIVGVGALLMGARTSSGVSGLPEEMLYPKYLKNRDEISYTNVRNELRFRFWAHKFNFRELPHENCYKMQRRLGKALEIMREAGAPIPEINDETAFDEKSPIREYMKLQAKRPHGECSFSAYKEDANANEVIYCKYHGLDRDMHNDFAKRHIGDFRAARPFINAFDVAELILFLPALIIFGITLIVLKKII